MPGDEASRRRSPGFSPSVSVPAEARGLGSPRFHRGGGAAVAVVAAAAAADTYGYGYGYGPYYGRVYRYCGW